MNGILRRLLPKRTLIRLMLAYAGVSIVIAATAPGQETGERDRTGDMVVRPGTAGKDLPRQSAGRDALRLAIVPDRTTGRDWGLKYLKLAVADLARIGPDAVFSIGDMVQGYTRSERRWRAEADRYFSLLEPLEAPFFPTAGNHDVISGYRDSSDHTFEKLYQQTFGPLYYSVDFDQATVIVCYSDAHLSGGHVAFDQKQLEWLREELARLNAGRDGRATGDKPIFVLMHRPMWRSDASEWDELVHPMLARAGVDAVIAGHFHSMQREPDRDGVEYHILGVCGGMIDQHPLTGQLHHVTFLRVGGDGDFSVYHQPVGTTLPDDFVHEADQARAWRLKSSGDVAEFQGAVSDPFASAVDQEIVLSLSNPLEDVPVQFEVELVDALPEPRVWGGSSPTFPGGLVSWTQRDNFNSYVSDVHTPFAIVDPIEEVELGPGERGEVRLRMKSPRTSSPPPPPEVWVTATFHDEHDRDVPVIVRKRVPIARRIDPVDQASVQWPVCSWESSVYDTLEANPSAQVRLVDSETLEVLVTVPDDRAVGAAGDERPVEERKHNPMADAVVLELHWGQRSREYYLEPFGDRMFRTRKGETWRAMPAKDVVVTRDDGDGVWTARMRVPFAGTNLGEETSIIVLGVADNDQTYHTQWRWLGPKEWPVTSILSR